jgi:hypothetical protein
MYIVHFASNSVLGSEGGYSDRLFVVFHRFPKQMPRESLLTRHYRFLPHLSLSSLCKHPPIRHYTAYAVTKALLNKPNNSCTLNMRPCKKLPVINQGVHRCHHTRFAVHIIKHFSKMKFYSDLPYISYVPKRPFPFGFCIKNVSVSWLGWMEHSSYWAKLVVSIH